MSFDVVMFETDNLDGVTAYDVEVLDSTDDVIVVKASFRKPEPVPAVVDKPLPFPDPTPPPEVEDPGPSEEQVDFKELGDLPKVLVDA